MDWILAVAVVQGATEAQELEEMKRRIAELERKVAGQEQATPDLPRVAQDPRREAGEVYGKPFLARFGRGTYLGGYIDLEFFNVDESNSDTFDQHRLVPFIYADVSKNVKVAAEIEIEHGNGTELGVEFAHVDYWMAEAVNLRAGIILDPLGRFNLVHDAPYQDLTTRPLVDEVVIPAVLREPGIGLFGSVDLDPWEIEYEAYVVNGFKGLDKKGAHVFSTGKGLRDARPHGSQLGTSSYRDFNDNKAVVGRLSVSPFLGLEAGGSAHSGKYDEGSDNTLTIWAFDWSANLGGLLRQAGMEGDFFSAFEVVGEYAYANIGRDSFARASGVPDDFRGVYVEPRFHFMPAFLRDLIPGANEESTFTLVYRHDWVDLDGFDYFQDTVGLNFRPREDTVFKFEYQWRDESGKASDVRNDRFVFSVATYF